MNVKFVKSFLIPGDGEEFGGGYGGKYRFEDGTEANVVTIYTGPGLGSETQLQANRCLTLGEKQALLDADSLIDHANGDNGNGFEPLTIQATY